MWVDGELRGGRAGRGRGPPCAARPRRRLGVGRRGRARRARRRSCSRRASASTRRLRRDALARNHMPRMHRYGDVHYLALHRPQPGAGGHVHYLELDLFVGPRYLVTVHGPRNPVVPLSAMVTETDEVAKRMAAGRCARASPMALVYAHIAALTASRSARSTTSPQEVGRLEQRVMARRTTTSRRRSSTSCSWCATSSHGAHHGVAERRDPRAACTLVLKHLPEGDLEAHRGPARPVRPARPDRHQPAGLPRRASRTSTGRAPTPG